MEIDIGAVATGIFFDTRREPTTSYFFLKDDIFEYMTSWTVQLCSCFFISKKLKAFCFTQNKTPKTVKTVRLYE